MEHREAEDWRIALEVAKLAPNTGVVPMRCATALAVNAELVMLREWVEDLKTPNDEAQRGATVLRCDSAGATS